MTKILIAGGICVLVVLGIVVGTRRSGSEPDRGMVTATPIASVRRVDFASVGAMYQFSGEIPVSWNVAYISEIDAINLSDQIFIRNFVASDFLTLSTVTIHSRESDTVQGHAAVRYEIEKKPGVADFPYQPAWRNRRHRLIDIRLAPTGRTTFFVIAANPDLDPAIFETFISSMQFE